jgi:hypothetical protein
VLGLLFSRGVDRSQPRHCLANKANGKSKNERTKQTEMKKRQSGKSYHFKFEFKGASGWKDQFSGSSFHMPIAVLNRALSRKNMMSS